MLADVKEEEEKLPVDFLVVNVRIKREDSGRAQQSDYLQFGWVMNVLVD